MIQPGRKYSAGSGYRYGFNGKENDNEVKGEANQQDYGRRIYDSRLGKFLSVDPLTSKYPELTPFQFASNRPIDGVDLDGLEYLSFNSSMYRMESGSNENLNTHVTTEYTIVAVIYANVPTLLQDPQTQSFKFIGTGPVTTAGRDYDADIDGTAVFPAGKYWVNGPEFYGTADGATSTNGITSLKGNVTPATVDRAAGVNAFGSALGRNGAGVVKNWYNLGLNDVQGAINDEWALKKGFYTATNTVDSYISKGLIGGDPLNNTQRSDLINFLTDGYLRTEFADNLKDEFTSNGIFANYSIMRKNIYASALNTAYTGIQIMNQKGIGVQSKTKEAITDLLSKYKANGGGNEYDDVISDVLNEKKDDD